MQVQIFNRFSFNKIFNAEHHSQQIGCSVIKLLIGCLSVFKIETKKINLFKQLQREGNRAKY